MRITDVYVGYLKITRIIQIGSILVKHGFKEMISHTFLGRRIRKRRIRQHKPVYTTQERLRLTIEDLGPTYIKFGQILADRPDILSERFRKELKKLQTNALPFDDHLAIRLIEDELGAEIKDVFFRIQSTLYRFGFYRPGVHRTSEKRERRRDQNPTPEYRPENQTRLIPHALSGQEISPGIPRNGCHQYRRSRRRVRRKHIQGIELL